MELLEEQLWTPLTDDFFELIPKVRDHADAFDLDVDHPPAAEAAQFPWVTSPARVDNKAVRNYDAANLGDTFESSGADVPRLNPPPPPFSSLSHW